MVYVYNIKMFMKDVYNMDETTLFYHAQANKTPTHGQVCGHKIHKDHQLLLL